MKYTNKEHTQVRDGNTFITPETRHWERVERYLAAGNTIEDYQTASELLEESKQLREAGRDLILAEATVDFEGHRYLLSIGNQHIMEGFINRNKNVNWKAYNLITGITERVSLNPAKCSQILEAIMDAGQVVHNDADTKMPTNPWPLEIDNG